MTYIYFTIGLALLVFGGDLLVRGAVSLAKKMHLSPLLIGIVLIGFGTSTPELVASLLAVLQTPPSPGIAVGNIIGSNIANIFLVLGISAIVFPISIDKTAFRRDSTFLILSSLVLGIVVWVGSIHFFSGLILVALLVFYVRYCYITEKRSQRKKAVDKNAITYSKKTIFLSFLVTVFGIALTIGGAQLLVISSISIAKNWGISETIIGLTLVAVGTSLPELAASVMASIRHHNDFAFGNVVGSNIYNALFILGFTALITPVQVPSDVIVSLFVMMGATALLILSGFSRYITRSIGVFYLILYVGYVAWLAQS